MHRLLRMKLVKMGKVKGATLTVTFNFYFHIKPTKGIFLKGRLFTMVQWCQSYHLGTKMTYSGPVDIQKAQLLKHQVMYLILFVNSSGMREFWTTAVLVQESSRLYTFLRAGIRNQYLLIEMHKNKQGHCNLSIFISREDLGNHYG